jgi:glycosyltransferase involved in cell wall biosynthesis
MGSYDPQFSVVVFTYNRAELLRLCLESIIKEANGYNCEIIISDNCSDDHTELVVKSFRDNRVLYFCNNSNLGLCGNLQAGTDRATADIVILMGDDDILLPGSLSATISHFGKNPEVGLVTRPYYWFTDNAKNPVREVAPPADGQPLYLKTLEDKLSHIEKVYETAGQISGLAFRKSFITRKYNTDIFTTHLYIFSELFLKHSVVVINQYSVAVKIGESMCRHNPEIYNKSPLQSWVDMFNAVYSDKDSQKLKRKGIENIASHVEGIIQIKSYGSFFQTMRELGLMIYYRPRNLISLKFLLYSALSLIAPRNFVIKLTDVYKRLRFSKRINRRLQGYGVTDVS